MQTITCARCGKTKEFPDNYFRRFCSATCKEGGTVRFSYPVSPGTLGAISELNICSDLLSKGYAVFRAASPSSNYDMVVDIRGKLHRVEVKTGAFNRGAKLAYHLRPEQKDYDILAVVTVQGIYYFKRGGVEPFPL